MASTNVVGGYNPQQSFSYPSTDVASHYPQTPSQAAFGTQVGQVNLPNPSAALGAEIPGVSGLNTQLSGLIGSELAGNISPQTMQLLQNAAGTFGVNSGMPKSGLSLENLLANIGLTSQAQQQAGVANYNQTIPTVSSTQTLNPALAWEANLQNAVSAASPDPRSAAEEQLSLLLGLSNPSGGTGSSSGGGSVVSSWEDVTGTQHQGIPPS